MADIMLHKWFHRLNKISNTIYQTIFIAFLIASSSSITTKDFIVEFNQLLVEESSFKTCL
jgi:hypothetical protein